MRQSLAAIIIAVLVVQMTEFVPKVFAVARELNRADSGGIGTYEWNHYEAGDRDSDTMRHVNGYIERARAALKAAESVAR